MVEILESSTNMATPTLQVRLTPRYSDGNDKVDGSEPKGLDVTMTISCRPGRFTTTTPFLTLPLNRGPTETARYDFDALSVSTASGKALSLHHEDERQGGDVIRNWYLAKVPAKGDFIVRFFAPPRKTDKSTPTGPRIDLRRNTSGGGLCGSGEGFIPVVPDNSENGSSAGPEIWDITIDWCLDDAPDGTRCAWSLGDGVHCTWRDSLYSSITRGVFAVGMIRRYPSWDGHAALATRNAHERQFAMYWFGDPFFDMAKLPRTAGDIFNSIASFFSSPNGFRVFMREVDAAHGGTGFTDSFLLEYSQPAKEELDDDTLGHLLSHETVHEYALLDPTEPPAEGYQESEGAWYVEGIAEYYGSVAPYGGSSISRTQLIDFLNDSTQAYYTSPVVDMEYGDYLRRAWDDLHITRICYYRGFIYIAAENGRIRKATGGAKSFDDVALELYRRRLSNEPNDVGDYRALVADIVGEAEEAENYMAMYRGDLIVPSSDALAGLGLTLVRRDAEKFELGFHSRSMSSDHIIRDLVKGSRAEEAGVREGDEVVESWMTWGAADSLDAMMQIRVRRGDEVKTIKWWPRS